MVRVNVAVMDYCSCSIKLYKLDLDRNWQADDVECWLLDNTDYRDICCYFMCSEKEIIIE